MAPAQVFWSNGGVQAHWCHVALQAGAQLFLAPHLLKGWARHQGLRAQEGTHGPAAAAGLGVTPRVWEGHSETGRGGLRRAGHGLLGTGEWGQRPSCPLGPHSTGSSPLGCGVPTCPLGCGTISLSLAKPCLLGALLPSAVLQATYPTTAARPFHCLHAQLLSLLLVPSLHSPPSLGKGCPEQVNSYPGGPSLSCLSGRSTVVAPQLVLPTDPEGVSSLLQLSCPCRGSSPGKQICFSHLSHPLAASLSREWDLCSCARTYPEHRQSTLGKILLKSGRCLWPRRQICVLVRVDSQVHTPIRLFPRAGRGWKSQQRSEPAPWAGDGTELSVVLVLLLPPLLQLHGCISTEGNRRRPMRRVSCSPGLHRSGWGVPPAKGPFGMQLSLCTAACWAPRAPW